MKIALTLFFLCFCTFDVNAQKKVLRQGMFKDLEVTNYVTKSYQDSSCTFHLKVMDDDYSPDLTKRYFWFHQGEMKSTVGNYTGKLLHGPYEKFDRDGALMEKGSFSYGLKDDQWLSWYRNGNISRHYQWQNGERIGTFEEFFSTGEKARTGSFKSGKLHGKLYQYDLTGAVISEAKYKRGKLIKEKVKKVRVKKVKAKRPKNGSEGSISTTPPNPEPVMPEKKRKSKRSSVAPNNPTLDAPAPPKEKKKRTRKKTDDVIPAQPVVQPMGQP